MKNKTFRLFVSSTFNDFGEERSILHDRVLPRIKGFCRERGYEFQMIDLRWGIYSEDTLNHKTLPICISEVKKCKEFSPQPNFLAMVGERYGWVPLPPFIVKDEFDSILGHLDETDKDVLKDWYIFDSNEIGGHYYLKYREGDYVDDTAWSDMESRLRCLLIKGADGAGFAEDTLMKYTASATEHEIINGFFGNELTADSGIALFRTGHPMRDKDPTRINSLKSRISAHIRSTATEDNLIELDYGADYLASFESRITEALERLISDEMKRLDENESLQSKKQRLLPYYNEGSVYVGKERAYASLREYINGSTRHTMFVEGESGSGKTTLLAKLLSEYEGASTFAFYGEGSASCSIFDTIEYISDELWQRYRGYSKRYTGKRSPAEAFRDAIRLVPSIGRVHLIVIDGIDMMSDISILKENFLPSVLPRRVKIIISSADKGVIEKLRRPDDICLNTDQFNLSERVDCFGAFMANKNRRLREDPQLQAAENALKHVSSPLQVKLLSALASKWRSDETYAQLPTEAKDIAAEYIRDTYEVGGHHRDTVLYSLALIASAPLGLTEYDVLSMLTRFDSVKEYFYSESKHENDFSEMPYAVWSRLFFDLGDCLEISFYDEDIIVKFSHNIFPRIIAELFPEYCERATAVLLEYLKAHAGERASSARMELMLLEKLGLTDELAQRLTSVNYISHCIKHGYTAYITEQLSRLVPKLYGSALYDRATRTLECLIHNRGMLMRYKTEFRACAYKWGLISAPVPALEPDYSLPSDGDQAETVPFIYSSAAKLAWSPDSSAYAVYERSYVYICDAESHIEKAVIYLESRGEKKLEASCVKWLTEDMLALTLHQDRLLIYDLSREIPQKLLDEACDSTRPFTEFLRQSNLLIYCDKENIIAKDISDSTVKYKIPSKSRTCVCLSDDKKTVTVRERVLNSFSIKYSVWDAQSGKSVKVFSVKNKEVTSCKTEMYSVAEGQLLQIYSETGLHGFLLQRGAASDHVFLHPPKYWDIIKALVGYRYMICVYEDCLLAVDLTSFRARYLLIDGITHAAWIKADRQISVLTRAHRMMNISLDCFEDGGNIFTHSLNLFDGSLTNKLNVIGEILSELKRELPIGAPKEYGAFFSSLCNDYEGENNISISTSPTLLTVANNGMKAIAYEYRNTVALLDANDKLRLTVDNLFLGIDNNILNLSFSEDSKFLLMRTNGFIRVISTDTGRFVLNLPLWRRPAAAACFTSDGRLRITLCNGESYEAVLSSRCAKFTRRLPRRIASDGSYKFAYYVSPDMQNVYNTVIADDVSSYSHSSEWINHRRRYFGKNSWLLYTAGRFYLNGDDELGFKNCDEYDFEGASNDCISSYASSVEAYVSEKNDITSEIFEYDSLGLILLVCKKMNSVILFDIGEMKILSAYKANEKIIGVSMNESMDSLTLHLDSLTRTVMLKINLPELSLQKNTK